MDLAQGSGQTVLYQVVSGGDIARERPGVTPQARDLGFDVPMDVDHESVSRWLPRWGGRCDRRRLYRRAVIG
jgi:hypothetical protein